MKLNFCPAFFLLGSMSNLKYDDKLFEDSCADSEPLIRLVFDIPSSETDSLFGNVDELKETGTVVKLFPDNHDDIRFLDLEAAASQPIIRLLPDNPGEEAVLRLRVQLLEAKLARQNAQINFSERIDVDHLEWRRQQNRLKYLEVGNILLMILTFALMVCAGCLAVIR